jgi:anti-sigma B factor antagonist
MSETAFSVSVETTERCAVVSVVGEVDVATAPGLRDQLNESMALGLPILVVDMLQTTFLDSTGLGILIETMKETESRGTSLRIVASDPRLLKVFTITGLTESFDIRTTRQEAGVE